MDIKLKLPQHKKTYKKGSLVINPEAYWAAVLLLIAAMIIFSLAFGFLLFKKVGQENTRSAEDAHSRALVREARLSDAIKYFEARQERSAEIVASPSPIVDPSL